MYPIYNLDYKKCLHCGSNSVFPCDNRGYQSSELMIYTVTHMKCKKCGKEFILKWIPDDNDPTKMIPVCTDHEELDQVINSIVDYSKSMKIKEIIE